VGGLYVVFATSDPSVGKGAISAFLVPRGTDGVIIGRDEDLIGLRGCPTTELSFRDVRVPTTALLGEEGEGFRLAMASVDDARLSAAAQSLGIARGAIELAIAYARERIAFGKPIIEHQGLQFLLADATTQIAAGWALLDQAIRMLEAMRSRQASAYAAMAKLFCTDVGMKTTVDAVQVFGGYGLTKDYEVERMMRDAKAFQIFDGTNQIQRMVIGRYVQRHPLPVDVGYLGGDT
jgi:acyl-CoA dehydrogenase